MLEGNNDVVMIFKIIIIIKTSLDPKIMGNEGERSTLITSKT